MDVIIHPCWEKWIHVSKMGPPCMYIPDPTLIITVSSVLFYMPVSQRYNNLDLTTCTVSEDKTMADIRGKQTPPSWPCSQAHDDVIKWKHFPRDWPFVRSPVNSPHKGQWRGALMFSFICVWINGWVNNREAGNLRCYRAHYDVNVMYFRDMERDRRWSHRIKKTLHVVKERLWWKCSYL